MSEQPPARLLALSADVVELLPEIVRTARKSAGLTLRQVEDSSGVPDQTLHRVERGGVCNTATAAKLLRWAAAAGA